MNLKQVVAEFRARQAAFLARQFEIAEQCYTNAAQQCSDQNAAALCRTAASDMFALRFGLA